MLQDLLQNKGWQELKSPLFTASPNVRFNEMDVMRSCIGISSMWHHTCLGHQGGHLGPPGSSFQHLPLE